MGLSAAAWTVAGTLVGAATLVATILIAVIVQRASRRSAANAQRVTELMAELSRRSRLDDIRRQLREETDPGLLRLLIEEARRLAIRNSEERFGLEAAYFTNPAAPLLTSQGMFPADIGPAVRRALVERVIKALPARYPSSDPETVRWMPEFAHLTRLAIDTHAPVHEIAGFIAARASDGWHIGDGTIRSILYPEAGYVCPPNLEAASDFLYALRHARVTRANMINMVAGISLAIWDFHRTIAPRAHLGNTLTAYILLMQSELHGVGEWEDEPGMTIAVDHAVAILVDAIGLSTGQDEHLNMRALQALIPLLAGFPESRFTQHGIVAEHLSAGVSALLATNAPPQLRDQLREHALRLVPTIRTALDR